MDDRRTTRLSEKMNKIQTRSMDNKPNPSGRRSGNSNLALIKKRAKARLSEEQQTMTLRDPYQTAMDAKDIVKGATSIVYDERMAEHRCLWDENYPECPERFTEVLKRCRELNLIERCQMIESRAATVDEVLLKHTIEQYELLKSTSGVSDNLHLEELSSHYDAIFIHPTTFDMSLLAAGSTIKLVNSILTGGCQNGMAIIRPPGHHAMRSEYNGYCFFNNVAIAAQHALNECGCKRILIIDWDVHHGQGTQRMFYDDPRVMYVSIHRFENGTFWPNLRESNFNYVGEGKGKGFNINVPLNKIGMSNADYLAIFQQLIIPVALEFDPELVIVSAGYDAAVGCPEGEMEITPACYAHLLSPLMALAGGKVAVVLEGGYCLKSLAEGAAITLKTLLGDPCPNMEPLQPPNDSIQETILNCISVLRPYWKNLNLQQDYSKSELNNTNPQQNLHKVVVNYEEGPPKPERFETRDCYPQPAQEFLSRTGDRLLRLQLTTNLNVPVHRLCYVYDEFMQKHRNMFEQHPENPNRILRIAKLHEDYKLFERMHPLKSRSATNEELGWTHAMEHVELMDSYRGGGADMNYQRIGDRYNSVFFNEYTVDCAKMAAGSVLQVVDEVMQGNTRSGLCIVRPPGHHAESDLPHGFCIFNNVAVAANYARRVHNVKRVLIVDWDIHHGNGTQHIFESDPGVLYVSLHRYDHGNFFPKSTDANFDVCGSGRGEGFNVNIPWNRRPMGDAEYLLAFQNIIMPIAYEYEPELVLVSAGFDAAIGDPLGGYKVTPEAYGIFTHWLSSLAHGRVIVCLEGGYNCSSISYAMVMCTKALLGDPLARSHDTVIKSTTAIESIQNVLQAQQKYWKCLRFSEKKLPNFMEEEQQQHEGACDSVDDILAKQVKDMVIEAAGDCSNKSTNQGVSGGAYDPQEGSSSQKSVAQCPTKTLAEYLEENQMLLDSEQMYAVVPKRNCPHLAELVNKEPPKRIDTSAMCGICQAKEEVWFCLHCWKMMCGRYIKGHMSEHYKLLKHPLALSMADLSCWCYGCEDYIDNAALYTYKNLAHRDKFHEDMPWCYDEICIEVDTLAAASSSPASSSGNQ